MLQQVLNRNFVLSTLAQVRIHLERVVAKGERRSEKKVLSNLSGPERRQLLEEGRQAATLTARGGSPGRLRSADLGRDRPPESRTGWR
jgi:hypothetical protein